VTGCIIATWQVGQTELCEPDSLSVTQSIWYGQSMRIHNLLWPDERIEHIARHAVTPAEFEEVCFGHSLVLRAKSEGSSPVYYVLGQTAAGRYLFCVVIAFVDGNGYPVTARSMTDKEKRRFRESKHR